MHAFIGAIQVFFFKIVNGINSYPHGVLALTKLLECRRDDADPKQEKI
jgi:hypothetical protein